MALFRGGLISPFFSGNFAMQFILYKTSSADNVINKTIVEPLVMEINLRRGVDIVAPVLRIEYVAGDSPTKYNYCHIPDLERFYFVRDVHSVTHNVWELRLECDVLETYKVEILASNARYKRNVKTGDYVAESLNSSVNFTSQLYESDKGFDGNRQMVLTTVGG